MTTPVYQQPQGGYGYPPLQASQNPFPSLQQGYGPPQPQAGMEYEIQPQGGYGYPPPQASYGSQNPLQPLQQGYGPPQPQADMEYGTQPQGGYGYPPPQASYVSQNSFPPPQQAYEPSEPHAGQWISAPTVPINCPPGLEYLTSIDQLLVQQKVELFEDTDCCTRYFCGPIRPFDMKILDNTQREVIHLYRPLKCQSCCFPCCLQRLEVMSPPGQVIGYVTQEWSLCIPKFRIEDASGECVLRIEGPFCIVNCCGDIKFRVLSKDGSTKLGKITKQWSGLLREAYTDADNFGISFPLDLDVNIKAVLLGACFLIDFMFFEKSADK